MPTPSTLPSTMPAAPSPAPVSLATRGVIQVPSYHLENRGRVGAACGRNRHFQIAGIPPAHRQLLIYANPTAGGAATVPGHEH